MNVLRVFFNSNAKILAKAKKAANIRLEELNNSLQALSSASTDTLGDARFEIANLTIEIKSVNESLERFKNLAFDSDSALTQKDFYEFVAWIYRREYAI